MKKILIASVIALTVALVGASVNASFDRNLSVGSTGADVTALQTWLMDHGFDIAPISSGAAQKGYFGQSTKAAVVAYQASVSVPTTGFVGPLTRAALNGSPTVSTGMTLPFPCPTGYTAPAGWVCPGTTTTGTGTSMNGTDGSVSVSQSSYVSSGQSVKKGETKNVVAVKLQATAGPVTVTRVDAHFSVRPWLFFSVATLTDSTGKVLATKTLSSINDVTEITVGSDYLVRFDGLSYVVTPGTNPDLTVGVSVLSATDKITNGMTVYAGIPSGAIRTINGLGFTDSVGGASAFTGTSVPSGAGQTSFTLTSTGNVADISVRVSPNAPASQVTVPVSATVSTSNVELGVFSLKSANNSSTINAMTFQVNTNPNFAKTGLFSNLRMIVGGNSIGALSFDATGAVSFTNLTVGLKVDEWTEVKLIADVAATSTNVLASSTINSSSISAIDSTYTTATIASGSQTSANTLLTVNSMSLTASSKNVGTAITTGTSNAPVRYPVTYTFTLTNSSSNNLFISSDVSTLLGTSTSPTNASSTITSYFPIPSAVSGDVAGSGYVVAAGSSRTFTVTGTIQKSSNSSTAESLSISGIKYATSAANALAGTSVTTINTGLEALSALVAF